MPQKHTIIEMTANYSDSALALGNTDTDQGVDIDRNSDALRIIQLWFMSVARPLSCTYNMHMYTVDSDDLFDIKINAVTVALPTDTSIPKVGSTTINASATCTVQEVSVQMFSDSDTAILNNNSPGDILGVICTQLSALLQMNTDQLKRHYGIS
jgi:hypothetical protein